jgi:hypothetical protein
MKMLDLFSRKFKRGKDGCSEWETLISPGLVSSVENRFYVDCLETGLGPASASRLLRIKYQCPDIAALRKAIEANLYGWAGRGWEAVALFEAVSGVIGENADSVKELGHVWNWRDGLAQGQMGEWESPEEFDRRLGSLLITLEKLFQTELFNSAKDLGGLSARALSLDAATSLLRLGYSAQMVGAEEIEKKLNEIFFLTVSHYRSWREFAQGYLAAMVSSRFPIKPEMEKSLPACLYSEESPWSRPSAFE